MLAAIVIAFMLPPPLGVIQGALCGLSLGIRVPRMLDGIKRANTDMPKFIMGPHETKVCQELAGPDLYYALKRLLMECGEGEQRGRAIDLLSRDTIEMAERALRKAEGN